MVSIRPAEPEDAVAAIDVVRQSIIQLCVTDHHNDETTLATWLANKTPQNFATWLSNTENFCLVAEAFGRPVGVGVVNREGEVLLFYLAPGMQRKGIGRMLHAELERQADRWELTSLHLESTALARRFYEAVGYRPSGTAVTRFGTLQCFPYAKQLRPDSSRESKRTE